MLHCFWKIEELPLTAALLAAVIVAVRMLPAACRFLGVSQMTCGSGRTQQVIAPALQLFSTGGI